MDAACVNSTYIQYRLIHATAPLILTAKAFVNYRDYHATTRQNEWQPAIQPIDNGLKIELFEGATPLNLFSDKAAFTPQFDWIKGFHLDVEAYRGQSDFKEDHIYAAFIQATLQPGESMTIVATTESEADLDGDAAYASRHAYERQLITQADLPSDYDQLVLAADQFVVKRTTASDDNGRSIIAGYHWFSDWGRDTMIALPGLTLTINRPDVAVSILQTYAQFVDRGMIPNRFPDEGEQPEYNTADATLWYFEALRAYHAATGDDKLIQQIYPILSDIIKWHQQGTRYNIKMDESDGLIFAGEAGVQLTWMDAKVDDWVVTPRIGKPVEINALWYNALCIMRDFAQLLGESDQIYVRLAQKVKKGYGRFWNKERGYCFDVIDGPTGNDASLRPNQLFAISLLHSPLSPAQQKTAVDACRQHLLTPHGLRSLAPNDAAYIGHYGGDIYKRDGAYHQGTVWGWLIGPFVTAHLRVYQNRQEARSFLEPLMAHLADHGIGNISEIFDGDAPFTPRGCIAQAWSVAELLRILPLTYYA